MYASDFPVEPATSWLPADIVGTNEELYDADPGPGGIYSRLAELGYGPVTVTETVRLRLPDDDESRFLRLNAEQRVYAIRRTATDETGRVVEVDDSVLPAHQWELVYTWPTETPALRRSHTLVQERGMSDRARSVARQRPGPCQPSPPPAPKRGPYWYRPGHIQRSPSDWSTVSPHLRPRREPFPGRSVCFWHED
jgi:UTRA domain